QARRSSRPSGLSLELRHDLCGEKLELAVLHVAGRRALTEEIPGKPLELAVRIALHEGFHGALDVVDGAAQLVALLDHALHGVLVALKAPGADVRVVLRIAEQLEEAEVAEVFLIGVAGRVGSKLEGLLEGVADADCPDAAAVLPESEVEAVFGRDALVAAAHLEKLRRVALPDPRQPSVFRAVEQ